MGPSGRRGAVARVRGDGGGQGQGGRGGQWAEGRGEVLDAHRISGSRVTVDTCRELGRLPGLSPDEGRPGGLFTWTGPGLPGQTEVVGTSV
ncbi:hypothetical protein GCM10010341_47270 [Streptomyces noursei]|nr:hypothetical protein GCM10010341_47270 [Streptomyces noursei]